MKIISKFKDYYDYVAHIHGPDEKITYDRKRIGTLEDGFVRPLEIKFSFNPGYLGFVEKKINTELIDCLVVAGKIFPVITLKGVYNKKEVITEEKHSDIFRFNSKNSNFGKENKDAIELSKLIGHPIFLISVNHYNDTVKVDGNCPILKDIGLASIYPAEQIYQGLSYFLINKMKDSPDLVIPSISNDKEKTVQHGFDLKQSFRHRK